MKKLILIVLTLTLAGCSALQTVPPTPQPALVPPTAQVIVATVLVPVAQTVIVTEMVQPTDAPTQEVASTAVLLTQAPADVTATPGSSTGPFSVDDTMGAGFFKNMTYSTNAFTLRCATKSVSFTATSTNASIVNVTFYYRIQDKNSIDISPWIDGNLMISDKQGNFTYVLSSDKIDNDWHRAATFIDFQFVGLDKSNQAVGRSEKIVKLISYSNDCQ